MFFFFNDTATTEIYTLSLHDALPICHRHFSTFEHKDGVYELNEELRPLFNSRRPFHKSYGGRELQDRKSTRLNSSHANISYAVFCLKKKKLHTISIAHI